MLIIQNDFERVALSALLHDVGKLIHRSNNYAQKTKLNDKKHPSLSSWFIDYLVEYKIIAEDFKLKELVQKHHEAYSFPEQLKVESIIDKDLRKLALIVSRSDNYSSQERDESEKEEEANFRTKPMDSIFSSIKIEKKSSINCRYKLAQFSEENIFPEIKEERKENSQEELNELINLFLRDVLKIKTQDFHVFYTNMLDLLKKYVWSVPSDTQSGICDISLYDHLKTSSAIAISTYKYLEEKFENFKSISNKEIEKFKSEDRYLLIGGDISGIQKYIYALESTEGAAKRLRARSFFIKMIANMAAYRIIKELELTFSNIIISSGGKFYILAPNTEKVKGRFYNLREEFNEELYKKYQTQIFMNMECVGLSGDELGKEFSKKYDKLNDKLAKNKHLKFATQIVENSINEDELYGKYSDIKACPICQKKLIKEDEQECKFCKNDFEIGGDLPFLTKLHFFDKKQQLSNNFISMFGFYVYLETEKKDFKNIEEPYISLYYKEHLITERNQSYLQDFYGGHVPLNENREIKDFETIASESSSGNLGILKGDVDNLGLIFSIGLKDEDKKEKEDEKISISRISFLSNMMDAFFSYYLSNKRLQSKGEKDSYYVVYSGGDDFMIVGPWDKLFEKAKEIQEDFQGFVSYNEDITITMGIAITHSKEPIYFSSKWASKAEEKGKDSGKNGIVIFDTYIKWEDYEKVKDLIKHIDDNFERDKKNKKVNLNEEVEEKDNKKVKYNQSFLYRLLNYTTSLEKYMETKNTKYLRYLSDFNYDVNRNLLENLKKEYKDNGEKEDSKKYLSDDRYTELAKYFGIDSIDNRENQKFATKYMRMILNYVIRKNRTKE